METNSRFQISIIVLASNNLNAYKLNLMTNLIIKQYQFSKPSISSELTLYEKNKLFKHKFIPLQWLRRKF